MPSLLEKLKKRMQNASEPTPKPLDQKEGYPIPTNEAEFAADERKAIVEFDSVPSDMNETVKMVMDIFEGTIIEAKPYKVSPRLR